MYSYSELNSVELSATKKDFYQIWSELLDLAGKLSERWDPSATNESDPGIVLLKVLTAIADKLNYAIDANTMEAFMPSASQSASMRKLCEMLGYNMKYYESATTTARITYNGKTFPTEADEVSVITIDQFTNLKDIDGTLNYITLEPVTIQESLTSVTVPCMEGELVACETDSGNAITLQNLDDNFRYYLPEVQVASNGIFLSNIKRANEVGGVEFWTQTDNLNIHTLNSKVYKFGFDAALGLPYLQFPDDIGSIIADGLQLYYVRTKGHAGNMSAQTLSIMDKPYSWSNISSTADWLNTAKYVATNISAAKNGRNPETIDEAYWNYQKTIGTFDTLVSCRDYMNKIYNMTTNETDQTPLVSNIIVSDIRDDINKAYTLTTMRADGIEYVNKARISEEGTDLINHFDLVLYPFKSVRGLNNITEFKDSFYYNDRNLFEIQEVLNECKTLAHNFKTPDESDVVCIKIYFKLDARISTTYKVSALEAREIEKSVQTALYSQFNMRYMNFGEELPFDTIQKAMETADPRIKGIILDDPKMTIAALCKGGKEHILVDGSDVATSKEAAEIYNKLILNNILAGRVALFNYNTKFATSFEEVAPVNYSPYYSGLADAADCIQAEQITDIEDLFDAEKKTVSGLTPQITKVQGQFLVDTNKVSLTSPLTLTQNEVIQFRLPSFKTELTYPAYVNYYARLPVLGQQSSPAYPATMQTLLDYFNGGIGIESTLGSKYWKDYYASWEMAENAEKDMAKSQWSPITSWEEKLNNLVSWGNGRNINFVKRIPFTEEQLNDQHTLEQALDVYLQQYHMLFVKIVKNKKDYYYSTLREKYKLSATGPQELSIADASNVIEHDWDNFARYTVGTAKDGGYYYLDINADNFTSFLDWLRNANDIQRIDISECDINFTSRISEGNLNGLPLSITEVRKYYKDRQEPGCRFTDSPYITSAYLKVASDYTYRAGYLVDTTHTRFKQITGWDKTLGNSSEVLTKCYLPRLWASDCSDDSAAHTPHMQTGVGSAAVPATIPANAEYQLKADEFILFNYTSSDEESDGSSVPMNVYYGPGTIIRPNFALADSDSLSASVKFYKTTGYGPWRTESNSIISADSIPGMYAFGVQEQVEIRKQIEVYLTDPAANIYWTLNAEPLLLEGTHKIMFPFDPKTGDYTLQSGEYFFYTDTNKQDLVYYGAGTVIHKDVNTPDVWKSTRDTQVGVEQINDMGILSDIPWQSLNLASPNGGITIKEYQYTNLVAGDTLKDISLDISSGESNLLRDTFIKVANSDARYILNGAEADLPKVYIDNVSWEVCSRLELNFSQTQPQVLHAHKDHAGEIMAIDKIDIYGRRMASHFNKDPQLEHIQTYNVQAPDYLDLALYSNRLIQNASGLALFELIDSTTGLDLEPLSIKVCGSDTVLTPQGTKFNLGTATDGFSALSIATQVGESTIFKYDIIQVQDNPVELVAQLGVASTGSNAEAALALPNTYKLTEEEASKYKVTDTEIDIVDIQDGAFYLCSQLKQVKLPNKLQYIGYYDFYGCKNLQQIAIPDSVTGIGNSAFLGCQSLKTIYFGEDSTLASIDAYAFEDCTSLTAIKLPTTLSTIGTAAFRGCKNLKVLYIPKNVTSIGKDAFADCPNLTLVIEQQREKPFDNIETWGCKDIDYSSSDDTPSIEYEDWFDKKDLSEPENQMRTLLTLHALIPDNHFGLISFYNQVLDPEEAGPIGLTTQVWESKQPVTLNIFNLGENPSWWEDKNQGILREGLNVILVEDSCDISIEAIPGTANLVTFSGLNIVDKENPLNPRLGCYERYPNEAEASGYSTLDPYKELLAAIRKLDVDQQFMYNAPINNKASLDLNYYDKSDTLRLAKHWFDNSNINNKFVITELDADYLSSNNHITVSKFSRY